MRKDRKTQEGPETWSGLLCPSIWAHLSVMRGGSCGPCVLIGAWVVVLCWRLSSRVAPSISWQVTPHWITLLWLLFLSSSCEHLFEVTLPSEFERWESYLWSFKPSVPVSSGKNYFNRGGLISPPVFFTSGGVDWLYIAYTSLMLWLQTIFWILSIDYELFISYITYCTFCCIYFLERCLLYYMEKKKLRYLK